MAINNQIRLYETKTYIDVDSFSGVSEEEFYVVSGARSAIALRVTSIDPATTVSLNIYNGFSKSDYDLIDTIQLTATGTAKRIYTDFFNLFKLSLSVVGGAATCKVAIAMFDNAASTTIEGATINADLSHVADMLGNFDSVRIGDGTDLLDINSDGSINDRSIISGSEDGTYTGNRFVFVNNARLQILASGDREQDITYADFGTKNQRVTQIDYTSPTFPGIIARKTIQYTLVGNKYRLDTIAWSIL